MREGRNSVLLGRFLVEIPNGRQGIRIFNLTRVFRSEGRFYGHPCVAQNDGQPCWGGFSRALGKLHREGNLPLAVDLVFEFLETWSDSNPLVQPSSWENDAEEFPREEGEKLVALRKKRALENLGAVQEGPHESLYNVQTPSGMTGPEQVRSLLEEEYRRQVGRYTGAHLAQSWTTILSTSPSLSISPSPPMSVPEREDGWNFEF